MMVMMGPVRWAYKTSRNLFGGALDVFTHAIHGDSDIAKTVVISGVPRGGTTWFLNILQTLPGYRSIFEPLHKKWFPELQKRRWISRVYLPPERRDPELEDYLSRVFKGNVMSFHAHYSIRPGTISKFVVGRNVVVKFIRANRLLPWIHSHFNLRGTYLLIRHPCAVVASQVESGIRGYSYHRDRPLPKEFLLNEAERIQEIRENRWLMRKLKNLNTHVGVLAAIWAIDQYVPLSYLSRHPDAWYVAVYERLVVDFTNEVKRIFEYIGEDVPSAAYDLYHRPSRTTRDYRYVGTKKQLLKWKEKLSERQVEEVLRVIGWFGIDFYNQNPEPDYDALRRWSQ